MRRDRALAKELRAILSGLHDPTISDQPFEWSTDPEEVDRRESELRGLRHRLRSYRHVSRVGQIAKLVGFGTALPLAILRDSYSFFRRGDEEQAITARIWGRSGTAGEAVGSRQIEKGRAFMMFVFYWVDVEVRTTYNASKKRMETKKERIPHELHGIFVQMPESPIRLRITEAGSDDELAKSIRLEYGALNKAVDVHCRAEDELEARKFLSPAVQEIVMRFSKGLPGLQLDFYPGHVLLVSDLDFLDDAEGVRLNRDGARFEERLQPWMDGVETFRTTVDDGLRGIAKYND